jgi:2-dehydro-3-deoxy-D-pentonate aldolase
MAPPPAREDIVARGLHLAGVYVALLTPFSAGGDVDRDALGALLERTLAGGVDGVVALGTTGEFADLLPDERRTVVQTTVATVRGRVPVVVGVGAVGTAESCRHAEDAEAAGADAVLSLPPLYWKLDDAELFAHFAAIAGATSLPVVLYEFPALSGTSLSPQLVRRISQELPSVVGIKLTVPDLRSVVEMLGAVKPGRPDFRVTVGFEDLALSALLHGADGLISGLANVCPSTLRRLVRAVADGDLGAAAQAHAEVLRLVPVYFQSNPPTLAVKALARASGVGIDARVRARHDPDVLGRVEDWAARTVAGTADRLSAPS